MDLTKIIERIPEHTSENNIFTFEKGQTIVRDFAKAYEDMQEVRKFLSDLGVKAGTRVGIRSPNCYEWMIYDLALISLRAVTVAFTDDFAETPVEDLCEKYKLSLFLTSAAEKKKDNMPKCVVFFGSKNNDVELIEREPLEDDSDFDRTGLIFSSGSSGGCKGLILNRKGIEAQIESFTEAVKPRREDRLLLFLPMSNFQQRLMYYAAFWYGFDLIVIEPVHLFRALQELAPTILIAPPMLYETFETRFSNLPKSKRRAAEILGNIAGAIPVKSLRKKFARKIFGKAYEALGGNMSLMITGMAPIKRSTLKLFSLMQLPLFETYGLIESGTVALNLPGQSRIGSVGKLLPGVSVDFKSDGEILVRREHPIAVGYFECAEGESEKTFVDGAVATGDIGRIDEDGFLYLVGRKKEIIITGGGEKVHPEVLEAEINNCSDIQRAVVIGMPDTPSVAVVVLPKEPENMKIRPVIERYIEDLSDSWRNVSIGKVIFTDIVFSRENGFLRPNLKLNRRKFEEHFLDGQN